MEGSWLEGQLEGARRRCLREGFAGRLCYLHVKL